MEQLNIKFYIENENHETYIPTTSYVCGVFAHGKLYIHYDLISTVEKLNECQLEIDDGVYYVTVVLPNGEERKCFLWYWHSISKAKLTDWNGTAKWKVPVFFNMSIQRGLLCLEDDIDANEYALECFNNRADNL